MSKLEELESRWRNGYSSQDDIDPEDYGWLIYEAIRLQKQISHLQDTEVPDIPRGNRIPTKITTTAGTLNKGDKIGRRVVRYSTFREHNLGHHVFFEGEEEPTPYGRNEPITVELANPGKWYLRDRKTKFFWHPIGSFWASQRMGHGRPKGFDDEHTATLFVKSEEERCPDEVGKFEVVFLL